MWANCSCNSSVLKMVPISSLWHAFHQYATILKLVMWMGFIVLAYTRINLRLIPSYLVPIALTWRKDMRTSLLIMRWWITEAEGPVKWLPECLVLELDRMSFRIAVHIKFCDLLCVCYICCWWGDWEWMLCRFGVACVIACTKWLS